MVGEKGKRLAGGVEPAVGLAGKLDMEPPVIAAGGEKREQRGKVDVAGPEGKVVVAAGEHVVDMDVDDEADERGEGRGQGHCEAGAEAGGRGVGGEVLASCGPGLDER